MIVCRQVTNAMWYALDLKALEIPGFRIEHTDMPMSDACVGIADNSVVGLTTVT